MNYQIRIYAVSLSVLTTFYHSTFAVKSKSKELRGLRLHAYVIHLVVMLSGCKQARAKYNYRSDVWPKGCVNPAFLGSGARIRVKTCLSDRKVELYFCM